MITNFIGATCIFTYLALIWGVLRSVLQEHTPIAQVKPLLIAVALLLHALLCILSLATEHGINYSLSNLLLLVTFVMTVIVVGLNMRIRQDILSVLIFGFSTTALFVNHLIISPDSLRVTTEGAIFAHIFLSVLAYSLLGLAAVQTIIFTLLQTSLRSKQHMKVVISLPPLDAVQRLNFGLLAAGMVALSITILVALFLYWRELDQLLNLVHTWIALFAWILYAAILLGRLLFGWHGKVTNFLSIAAFVLLALSYVGLRFGTSLIS